MFLCRFHWSQPCVPCSVFRSTERKAVIEPQSKLDENLAVTFSCSCSRARRIVPRPILRHTVYQHFHNDDCGYLLNALTRDLCQRGLITNNRIMMPQHRIDESARAYVCALAARHSSISSDSLTECSLVKKAYDAQLSKHCSDLKIGKPEHGWTCGLLGHLGRTLGHLYISSPSDPSQKISHARSHWSKREWSS